MTRSCNCSILVFSGFYHAYKIFHI